MQSINEQVPIPLKLYFFQEKFHIDYMEFCGNKFSSVGLSNLEFLSYNSSALLFTEL